MHEPVLIEHIHLLHIMYEYNKCVTKILVKDSFQLGTTNITGYPSRKQYLENGTVMSMDLQYYSAADKRRYL
jgi:hypothetical protein